MASVLEYMDGPYSPEYMEKKQAEKKRSMGRLIRQLMLQGKEDDARGLFPQAFPSKLLQGGVVEEDMQPGPVTAPPAQMPGMDFSQMTHPADYQHLYKNPPAVPQELVDSGWASSPDGRAAPDMVGPPAPPVDPANTGGTPPRSLPKTTKSQQPKDGDVIVVPEEQALALAGGERPAPSVSSLAGLTAQSPDTGFEQGLSRAAALAGMGKRAMEEAQPKLSDAAWSNKIDPDSEARVTKGNYGVNVGEKTSRAQLMDPSVLQGYQEILQQWPGMQENQQALGQLQDTISALREKVYGPGGVKDAESKGISPGAFVRPIAAVLDAWAGRGKFTDIIDPKKDREKSKEEQLLAQLEAQARLRAQNMQDTQLSLLKALTGDKAVSDLSGKFGTGREFREGAIGQGDDGGFKMMKYQREQELKERDRIDRLTKDYGKQFQTDQSGPGSLEFTQSYARVLNSLREKLETYGYDVLADPVVEGEVRALFKELAIGENATKMGGVLREGDIEFIRGMAGAISSDVSDMGNLIKDRGIENILGRLDQIGRRFNDGVNHKFMNMRTRSRNIDVWEKLLAQDVANTPLYSEWGRKPVPAAGSWAGRLTQGGAKVTTDFYQRGPGAALGTAIEEGVKFFSTPSTPAPNRVPPSPPPAKTPGTKDELIDDIMGM